MKTCEVYIDCTHFGQAVLVIDRFKTSLAFLVDDDDRDHVQRSGIVFEYKIPVVTSELQGLAEQWYEGADDMEPHPRLICAYFYEAVFDILGDDAEELGEPALCMIQYLCASIVMERSSTARLFLSDDGYKFDDEDDYEEWPSTGSELAEWNPNTDLFEV